MEADEGKNWSKIKMKKGLRINLQLSSRGWNFRRVFSCVWCVVAAEFESVKLHDSSGFFLEWSKLYEFGIYLGEMCM